VPSSITQAVSRAGQEASPGLGAGALVTEEEAAALPHCSPLFEWKFIVAGIPLGRNLGHDPPARRHG
jgi:hypothetical protein